MHFMRSIYVSYLVTLSGKKSTVLFIIIIINFLLFYVGVSVCLFLY